MPATTSGGEWQGSQTGQGTTELTFPGPLLEQMQGEAACLAGEPSGQREEASPEGLGGRDLRAQADPRRLVLQLQNKNRYHRGNEAVLR